MDQQPDLDFPDSLREDVKQTLLEAIAAAAEQSLPLFRTSLTIDNKRLEGFDPVTEADRGAERAIRGVIGHRFPAHAILGEELEYKEGSSAFTWIIDPIDGTRAFISGIPVWGTLIGFGREGRMLAGIMHQPFIGEIFLGIHGHSEYRRNGESTPLQTSGLTTLSKARMATTAPFLYRTTRQRAAYQALEDEVLQARYGLDCYGFCLLAAGHLDVVIEAGLQSYDIAALIPIIEGAGGAITTWDGDNASGGGDVIAAASPDLLEEALRIIRSAER